MGHPRSDGSESRFAAYVEGLVSVIGPMQTGRSRYGITALV
ncbi:hypothetical protein ACVWXO_005782 [Bradyrhizobium sp. LM2.7]